MIDKIKKIAEETPHTVAEIASSVAHAKKFNLPLDLQFFAEGGEGGEGGEGTPPADPKDPPADPPADPKDPPKTFTQEELDNIVKERMKRAEKDKQEAIKEAEKLAKMNADQKREYELEKLKRENVELRAAQNKYELGKEASRILSESGIQATDEVLDFVVKEDAETTNAAVKTFSELVDKISDEKMKEKLKGKPPKAEGNGSGNVNPFSKEHFNLTEQGRLLKSDPELYKQLKAQAAK